MEENQKLLTLILQRQEDISSRINNIEKHLSTSNIPNQTYTQYLPSIIPPHSPHSPHLPTPILSSPPVSSPPLSSCNQHLIPNASTSTFTDEDLQDLLQQIDTSTSTTTSTTTTTCPLPLPLKGKVRNTEYDSRLIHKHRLYSVDRMLKTNKYLITKHNSPSTLAQRLARRAVFGDDCLIQCTPLGSSIYLALPPQKKI